MIYIHAYFSVRQIVNGYDPVHARPWMTRLEIGRNKVRVARWFKKNIYRSNLYIV
jgi:hypothetical protein